MKASVVALCALVLLSGCLEKGGAGSLNYKGKPVDPICFISSNGDGVNADVSLAACTGSAGKDGVSVPDGGLTTNEDGAIGYNFQCEPEGCMSQPYLYYKYLGRIGDVDFVEVDQSGGGTGHFSDIRRIKIDGDIMRTQSVVAGGDRCNGGIASAHISNNALTYSQHITPFDLITLAQGNSAGFKAYDDIQACAACCVGEAVYVNDNLSAITLTQNPDDVNATDLDAKNACFMASYNDSYKKLGSTLAPEAIRSFGKTFNERCGQLK